MLYAIVDIETTGGYAAANGITEIAIRISDGRNVIESYETLINPVYTIPRYVESLTGITNEMVSREKVIAEVAPKIYDLLYDKIFVAHNVNFDYSFIKHHLSQSGYELNCKKICTIRYGRQVLPGLKSYGLGNFCRAVGIEIENRHRAGGDADATAILFHHLLQKDSNYIIGEHLKSKVNSQSLPPNLPMEHVSRLPKGPGVYYFHDNKGKVIYVGKAKNLFKRVNSHFKNNKPGKQKQEFLRKVYNITYKEFATELMAYIFECSEIRKFWPSQNRSLKKFEHAYGLYSFQDRKGYIRLAIEKKKVNLNPLYTFNLITEGHNLLRKLSFEFSLCPKLCYLQLQHIDCTGAADSRCSGACCGNELVEEYNQKVKKCVEHLEKELPTFILKDNGIAEGQKSYILVEKGRFYGMGNTNELPDNISIDDLKAQLTPYSENDYIRGLIYNHADQYPQKRFVI
ncbi:MAG: exonuclease domain-containing protein [Ginsengibacter sp.]